MSTEAIRFRIAPTPSGFLHEGNRHNIRLIARRRAELGASLLLRIDDLDAERKRPDYVRHIFDVLAEEGVTWDEGPSDSHEFESQWSQRHRLNHYHRLLDQLRTEGHLYACLCSRSDWATYEGDGCPRKCHQQALPFDTPNTLWRLKHHATPHEPGLTVMRSRHGIPAYHIASICDDIRFGITHVVRGEDLRASTNLQLEIARRLHLTSFLSIHFEHHPLVLDADGRKLSKSPFPAQKR